MNSSLSCTGFVSYCTKAPLTSTLFKVHVVWKPNGREGGPGSLHEGTTLASTREGSVHINTLTAGRVNGTLVCTMTHILCYTYQERIWLVSYSVILCTTKKEKLDFWIKILLFLLTQNFWARRQPLSLARIRALGEKSKEGVAQLSQQQTCRAWATASMDDEWPWPRAPVPCVTHSPIG
jgi:hypothetical protein